jgi:3-oxoacyl-[acyl-carrier protein] reductase
VRVNVINPGAVRTGRFTERAEKRARTEGVSAAQAEKLFVAEGGILRVGEPEDIAGMVAYLLSARAGYIQGSVFDLDGGKTKTL